MGTAASNDQPLEPVKPELVEEISPTKSDEPQERLIASRTTSELTVQSFEFSGPLPPPQILRGYNDAFAGCAERIVAMAERQSAHRQEIEKMVIDGNCRAQSRGQIFGFALAFMVIAGGVYLLAQGKSVEGFSAIILAGGSIIGALVFSRFEQKSEREQKVMPLPSAPPSRKSKKKKKSH
ncbi:MAG: DUF2335 domain-containing protein [Candidatus Binatus sp.]|uniref:DUF2335 domain-containing protein n=1 Tax=Candidatus Binatus sp. TaxID=2811406 RepID=UPI003C71E80B